MEIFKLAISENPTIRPEKRLLGELCENLEFYDDYDPKDLRASFIEACNLVCAEVASAENSELIIRGYGLEWKEYRKYLDNIFPEILDAISDLKNNKPTKLVFYDVGSERAIKFFQGGNGSTANFFYSKCYSLKSDKYIGVDEVIDRNNLIDQLVSLVGTFVKFSESYYPSVYADFLYPYLREYDLGAVIEGAETEAMGSWGVK